MNIVWRTLWFAFKGVNELYVVCETSNVISISARSQLVLESFSTKNFVNSGLQMTYMSAGLSRVIRSLLKVFWRKFIREGLTKNQHSALLQLALDEKNIIFSLKKVLWGQNTGRSFRKRKMIFFSTTRVGYQLKLSKNKICELSFFKPIIC